MPHHLLVLHFGAQCPWQPWVVEQAQKTAEQLGGTVDVIDATQQVELAARYRFFWPFMTIIDETIRLPSPTPAKELVRIAKEGMTVPPSTPTTRGPKAQSESILPLTVNNIADTCPLCIRSTEHRGCQAKTAWATEMAQRVPDGILGFVAYHDDQAAGVVEFLPAPLVPYPLPEKTPDIAFITCIYSTENGADYRGHVLERLVKHLQATHYRQLQVVAGQRTPYPNGPEAFFKQHRFELVGELDRVMLREGEESLILLKRVLK